jgi:transposase-like protein
MGRKSYSSRQKVAMVRTMEQRLSADPTISRRQIARDLGVDASLLRKWQQHVDAHISKVTRSNGCRFNPRACSLHPGRLSCLEPIKDILLHFIFEKREQGIPVSIKMVVEVAKRYDTSFKGKSYAAQDQAVRRFVDSHGFVHRAHTHQSQKALH